MGVVTNVPPKTLEERVQAITKLAKERNVDFDIWFAANNGQWGSNWGNGLYRNDLGELLELIEEDIRDLGRPSEETEELLAMPEEPKYQPWKP